MKLYRPLMAGLAILFLLSAAVIALTRYAAFDARGLVGVDHALFVELGRRWLETGSMYAPWQFAPYQYDQGAGTTDVASMPSLYPPLAGPLFAALTVLPPVLWWAIPLGAVLWSLRHARPWTWPLLALACCWPVTPSVVIVGGSTMWVWAGVALAGRFGWPALVVALKPTLAPFLLAGVRQWRSLLAGTVLLAIVSLSLLREWVAWLIVIRNADSPGLLYSLGDWPLLLALALATQQRQQDDRRVGLGVIQRAVAFRGGQGQEGVATELPEVT